MRIFSLIFAISSASVLAGGSGVSYQLHGQAWSQAGRIMQASDTVVRNDPSFPGEVVKVGGTSMQSLGAQITINADLGQHWDAVFGVGVYQVSTSLGTDNLQTDYPNFSNFTTFKNYLAQANLTYSLGDKGRPWLSVTAGNFSYDYNPDVKNLGLYLLRGPVYPGILMSGFQEFDTDTSKGIQSGFKLHHAWGNFSHDILFLNERVLPPMFDWSLAYVAKYKAFGALEIGAGVNFYRLVPYSKALETPGHLTKASLTATNYYEVKAPGDTVFFTHQGTKLMGMFSLDPKRWIPFGHMGSEDFKLYGEVAVLGTKNYGTIYNKMSKRILVMGGFNVPTFGILELLSLEVEWYGSAYRNDLANIGYPSGIVAPWMSTQTPISLTPIPSPGPVLPGAYADSTKDNWKWSVLMQKTVSRHIRFTGQIANDHYRPAPMPAGGVVNSAGGTAAVLTSPSDWYFMGRIGFFF
jgi:hypothetical protein